MLEEEWQDHLNVKLFKQRIWLEEQMEANRDLMTRELNHKMEKFKTEWTKEEERRKEEEKKALEGEGSRGKD